MNILFLSNDPKICVAGSPVRERMRSYADEVAKTGGKLVILTRTPHACGCADGPLVVCGMRAPKLLSPWLLARRARKLIR